MVIRIVITENTTNKKNQIFNRYTFISYIIISLLYVIITNNQLI